jgi:predicted RNA-binding Zn-ribbon protein involved in translation (DUF1610 family)
MARDEFTLLDSVKFGHTVAIRCHLCRRQHYYDPADFIRLFGNIGCRQVTERMTCEKCGTGEHLKATFELLPALKRQQIRLRRIKEIRQVRRVIWRDE